MFDIDNLRGDIQAIVYELAEEGMPVKAIARHPRVSAILSVLKPTEECEQFARHRYLQALIQRAKNADGTRRFVSIYRPRLFPLQDDASDAGTTIFYASLSAVERTPAYKVIALQGLRRLIFGLIRRAGYIGPETRDELVRLIGEIFDRMIGDIAA